MKKSILLISFLLAFSFLRAQPSIMSFDEYNLKNGESAAERLVSTDMIRVEQEGAIAKMKSFVFTSKVGKELSEQSFLENLVGRVNLWLAVRMNDNLEPELILYQARRMILGEGRMDYQTVSFSPEQRNKLEVTLLQTLERFDFERIKPEDKVLSWNISNFKDEAKTTGAALDYLRGLPDTTRKVDLSGYQLRSVPEELFRFADLESLNLSDNLLTTIPGKLWRRKNLKKVDLSKNRLTNRSFHLKRNKSIKTFNFQYNKVTALPKRYHKLKAVEDIFAGNNFLIDFEEQKFKKKSSIKNLNLYNTAISTLPERMTRLRNLEELDLYYNNLRSINIDIAAFQKLKTLALSFNGLWKLPAGVEKLQKLEKLYAHHNKIRTLPELSSSVLLLDMGYNLFEELPESVLKLNNLKEVDFSNCQLIQMPEELTSLSSLKTVFLSGNPFEWDKSELKKFESFKEDMQINNALVR